MGKMNCGRLILGGIVAGVVLDVLGFLVDGVMLAPRWSQGMQALGHAGTFTLAALIWFNLIGLAAGIALVWLYAAIRPRFGAGLQTAVIAGLTVWFLGTLLPNASFMWATGLFSRRLTLYTTLWAIAEVVIAAMAGAALYQEGQLTGTPEAPAQRPKQAVQA